MERLAPIVSKVWTACESKGVRGRTVTLKVKFSDFVQITRARSLADAVASRATLQDIGIRLLRDVFPLRRSVRLLGISLSALEDGSSTKPRQLGLEI